MFNHIINIFDFSLFSEKMMTQAYAYAIFWLLFF